MSKGIKKTPRPEVTLEVLFSKSSVMPNGCIEWQKSRHKDGYGRARLNGKEIAAHRLAAILAHGEPNELMIVLHSCDNPPCVNPAHLRWGTHKENTQEAFAKGRMSGVGGFKKSQSKVDSKSMKQIFEMRSKGLSYNKIAKVLNISYNSIWRICNGIGYVEEVKKMRTLFDNDSF